MNKNKLKLPIKIDDSANKKVYFGDDGQVVDKPKKQQEPAKKHEKHVEESTADDKTNGKQGFKKKRRDDAVGLETKWYHVHQEHNTGEVKDIKDSELSALRSLCKSAFQAASSELQKSEIINRFDWFK
jgi:hypothetical protein